MITNALITIFNRKRRGRESVLIPTVIRDASWFYGRSSSVGQYSEGQGSFKVRIPYGADTSGKTYVEPWEWKDLTDEQASECWTIQMDDIVVRGEMSGTVTDQTDITSATEDCFVVNEFANNTIRGSDLVKHWRIGGV